MAQNAFAIAILGITKKDFDYTVTAIPQPEAAYIPDGGTGKIFKVDVSPDGHGASNLETQKLTCKVFITHEQVQMPEGKRYKLGLLINAANGTVNIGPFFGNLDFPSGKKTLTVNVSTPLLNGNVTITLKAAGSNTVNIKSKFTGLLSGATAVDKDLS